MEMYHTLKEDHGFELRQYDHQIMVKVIVTGPFESAFRKGKGILEDYFEGENLKRYKFKSKPTFYMTSRSDGWEVACVLPPFMTIFNSPRPISDKIKFEEKMSRKVAVIKFQGKPPYPAIMRKSEELRSWAKDKLMPLTKNSQIVIYQSSFLTFMRKNEIHFEADVKQ